jgi:predicted dehydrogenase
MSVRFGIVGGGWRTRFFLRVARELPDSFEVCGVFARRAELREELKRDFGVSVFDSLDDLMAASPSFVVVAVAWDSSPILAEEISVGRGVPVLVETPPAPDMEGLQHLTSLAGNGARMQVAEQYLYQPQLAARMGVLEEGLIGDVLHTQVSICHGYHGMSVIRRVLDVGFSACELSAWTTEHPMLAPASREGLPSGEQDLTSSRQTICWLRFENGKTALFDFANEQYFSYIRTPRFLARGTHGEINNNDVTYQVDTQTYYSFALERQSAGAEGNLEGHFLKGYLGKGRWYFRNAHMPKNSDGAGRLSDDELAVARVLDNMGEYVADGSEFYSVQQAAQDRYLDIKMNQAVKSGETVQAAAIDW